VYIIEEKRRHSALAKLGNKLNEFMERVKKRGKTQKYH